MKRFISVLAIALILIMMSWGTANSDIGPQLHLVTYDHPWGGDQYYNDPPGPILAPKEPVPDSELSSSFRSWITKWYYNSIYYLNFLPKDDNTVDAIENTNTNSNVTNYNYEGTGK
ncbi:MAG: hypothetical protein V3T75_00845 [candidate division Zixibacteria bacterium]